MNTRRLKAAVLTVGLAAAPRPPAVAAGGELDGSGTQWSPFLEWSFTNPGYPGNPYDLAAAVTFRHAGSGETRTTDMFYDGADTWRVRFTATRSGTWTASSSSADPDLDGLAGTIDISANPDARARGFLTGSGERYVWQGSNEGFAPVLAMYAHPASYWDFAAGQPDMQKIRDDVGTFVTDHGFTGLHTIVQCRWFDIEENAYDALGSDPSPDRRTFQALEALIQAVRDAGGVVHIWAWGDADSHATPQGKWGQNGPVDRRLQRYIAARLGPIPGWTMGYGYDCDEWCTAGELETWRDYLQERSGWDHLLSARDPNPNRPSDPLTQITDALETYSFEHWRPNYDDYVRAFGYDGGGDKPIFSEDRFRIRQGAPFGDKDFAGHEHDTRQAIIAQVISGGAAAIYGNLIDPDTGENRPDQDEGSFEYGNKHFIRNVTRFFLGPENRFRADLVRDDSITDGRCLRNETHTLYVFYAGGEGNRTTSPGAPVRFVDLDLSGMSGPQPAIKVDTTASGYAETSLGTLDPQRYEDLDLGSSSDWLIAVGDFPSVPPTAVELLWFEASAGNDSVDLTWRTGSELDTIGFNLHRSSSEDGPWTRINSSLIPGLGSSPEGAAYAYRDTGLRNGTTYFYRLEDVDARSVSTFHGPVSATPWTSAFPGPPDDAGNEPGEPAFQAYGGPGEPSLRVLARGPDSLVLELATPGFVAAETHAGARVSVAGFDERRRRGAPALPLKRALVDAVVGRRARVVWAREEDVLAFPGLTPAAVGAAELVVRPDGSVRPGRRETALRSPDRGVLPRSAVRIEGDAFIGETKKLALEMSPLRYDASSDTLRLARTLRVGIAFDRAARTGETGRGSRGRRPPRAPRERGAPVLAHLHTETTGLHAIPFEGLGLPRPVPVASLRLSLLGDEVPFHVEPPSRSFGPGSRLFFYAAEEATSVDFSSETAYALERARWGVRMERTAPWGRLPTLSSAPLAEARFEANRLYQPGLLTAPDIWLWEVIVGGASRTISFSLDGLDPTSLEPVQVEVALQGGSEDETEGEHHLSVSLNGIPVGETSFDGRVAHDLTASAPASLLLDGDNTLTVTNHGDAGAYSVVFLDRVSITHPRTLDLRRGRFEGLFAETAKVVLVGAAAFGVDVTKPNAPVWLSRLTLRQGKVRFGSEAGHRYVLASQEGLLSPRVTKPVRSTLRDPSNHAAYVVIAPKGFLPAAEPLLGRRRDQGLDTMAVSFEEISSEFGHGRPSAQAIRDFLAYAFHRWTKPSLRYVLLLGDASSDPRDFTGRDARAPLPAMWVKTSYLWTASDPTLGAVNGEDLLPDVAIGRLPAATLEQARALIHKVLAWEDGGHDLGGAAILVADDPDEAGDFEADITDVRESFLGGRATRSILVRQYGAGARSEILSALDEGASLLSYVGHGGPVFWASENILNSWDPPSLRAQSEQPLMMAFGCLNGYFVASSYDSLAEAFLKVEGRGTIGAISLSGLSRDGPAHRLHSALMAELASRGHERLGDAVLAAQAAYAQEGVMPELLLTSHLFADPAMRIR